MQLDFDSDGFRNYGTSTSPRENERVNEQVVSILVTGSTFNEKLMCTLYEHEVETRVSINGILTETNTLFCSIRYSALLLLDESLRTASVPVSSFPRKHFRGGNGKQVVQERIKNFQTYYDFLIDHMATKAGEEEDLKIQTLLLNFFKNETIHKNKDGIVSST